MEQRRQFAGLKEGSQISGYNGYVPQLKYTIGGCYNDLTYDLAHKLPYYSGPRPLVLPAVTDSSEGGHSSLRADLFKDEFPKKKLPLSTGYNKYTENMVPGYSGDIPRWPFKFGSTYKNVCDECIDEFVTTYEKNDAKQKEVQRQAGLFSSMRPVSHDPKVKDHMNLWADNRCGGLLRQDRKPPTEPPIPGYMGYVARANVTDVTLGQRSTVGSARALNQFYRETEIHKANLGGSERLCATGQNLLGRSNTTLGADCTSNDGGRLYVRPGMIPNYTGYLPRGRYSFGHTYGDLTRSLDVCSHDSHNYGAFLRSKTQIH